MFIKCGYVIILLTALPCIPSVPLSEYVSRFDTLSYDAQAVHRSHARAKRSAAGDASVDVNFSAHSRSFKIRLKRDTSMFSDDLVVHGHDGSRVPVDTSHIYRGHVADEPDSLVFGSISDGIFEGKILTQQGSFYVEKAHHYFPKRDNTSFHSVIYSENDITDPYEKLRTGHVGGCGITEEVSQWMDRIQSSAVEEQQQEEDEQGTTETSLPARRTPGSNDPFLHKYSREANEGPALRRAKRATRSKEDNRNTCSLFIQTDPLIWRHITEQVNNDPEKTREEILSLIAHHVTAVNYIYRDTKFDGRVEHRNIKFEVQRIKIDDDAACRPHFNGEPNQFCLENIDVSNFLNLHSLGNHEAFCLAYVFTYRDFTGGTLGLAWVASASGASGGICEKYKTYTETVSGMYQSTKRSLNTGIITFVNYNSRVPPKVSQLTLAHEIGHNFGSPHDYPPECRPGGPNGNFIMFASATSGDRPNNSKFSSCSISNISNVLDAIVDTKKRNCFTASEGAFCGNKIVEAGEECDCGYDDKECRDVCCYPRIVTDQDKYHNGSARGCARRANTECSPSQGPCCASDTCRFIPASYKMQCKADSECSRSSNCNGRSAECPPPEPKDNTTRCNEATQLCINGECTGSICLAWNLSECFLTSSIIPNIDKRKLCELACQNGTDPASCRSTSDFAHLVGLPPGGISLRPGSPCDNFQGYCDVFFKCRAVDAEGPLARLKNLLFNKETLQTVAQWITEYWWAVLLMGIAFIIFMGLFIKCCAVHTPSSNPKKPPARRFSDTLRRPMNTFRRMRGPHSVPGGAHAMGGVGRSARGPTRGYGEGRASAPPASYSRTNHPELYAGAYGGRNMYEMRHHKV
ncbi:disintegrin and metalloproteinase domain-containing protein 10 [Bacillus rossius redtenbacheri]|uniref:disintegrin and metalloproteinase domain-containing protein 10 n=1 Tax=Bacillus rossius redtenbacheri TaxID=93214 RepID=UPI002FDCBAD8